MIAGLSSYCGSLRVTENITGSFTTSDPIPTVPSRPRPVTLFFQKIPNLVSTQTTLQVLVIGLSVGSRSNVGRERSP